MKYTDPDGRKIENLIDFNIYMGDSTDILGTQPYRSDDPEAPEVCLENGMVVKPEKYLRLNGYGCVITALTRIISTIWSHRVEISDVNNYAKNYFQKDTSDGWGDITLLSCCDQENVINGYLKDILGCDSIRVKYVGTCCQSELSDYDNSDKRYFVLGRVQGKHTVNIEKDLSKSKGAVKFFKINETHKGGYNFLDYSNFSGYEIFVLQRKKSDGTYEDIQ